MSASCPSLGRTSAVASCQSNRTNASVVSPYRVSPTTARHHRAEIAREGRLDAHPGPVAYTHTAPVPRIGRWLAVQMRTHATCPLAPRLVPVARSVPRFSGSSSVACDCPTRQTRKILRRGPGLPSSVPPKPLMRPTLAESGAGGAESGRAESAHGSARDHHP
jgi:hypothetical protein